MSTAETSPFLSSLQKLFERQKRNTLQEKAWDHFLELGLPDKSSDAFRYVPLRKLYDMELTAESQLPSKEEITSHLLPEAGGYLVFAGGRFCKELSQLPAQIMISSLQDALKTYGSFLQGRLMRNIKEEADPFAVLNMAAEQDGLFCYLPPKVKIEKPLQIIYYGSGHTSYHPTRLQFFLSSDSELKTVVATVGQGVHHTAIDAALEDRAVWSHLEMSTQGSGVHLNDFKATLKASSRLEHLSIVTSQRLTRNRLKIALLGEQADALLQGLWSLSGNHQCHTHVFIEHAAPNARSLQKYKGVLKDQAQSSFEGKIYVHPEAQKTEAYQVNRNLLLSEGAVANAKPNLEIFADDVKASHGATMSQVDAEQLFYLQSRGLTQETARNLLLQGFMQEIIQQIPYPSLRYGF